jgi:hypothetical protein
MMGVINGVCASYSEDSLRAGKTFKKPFFDLFSVNKGFLIKFAPPKPLFFRFASPQTFICSICLPQTFMSSSQTFTSETFFWDGQASGTALVTPAAKQCSAGCVTWVPLACSVWEPMRRMRSVCDNPHPLWGCGRVHPSLPATGQCSIPHGCTLCEHPNKSVSVLAN